MPAAKKKWSAMHGGAYNLDGRTLEGGGQLLRIAVGLSALTGRALSISHIRGNRYGGGLKAQHLACVKWLGQAADAEMEGADLKSQTLHFKPGEQKTDLQTSYVQTEPQPSPCFESRIDIGSPGSIALALQAVLPFILFSPPCSASSATTRPSVKLTITGGTNVTNSPSYEYLSQVLFPTLAQIGLPTIESNLEARGWSTGGSSIGTAVFTIPTLRTGEKLPAITLTPSTDDDDADDLSVDPSHVKATVMAPESAWEELGEQISEGLEAAFPTLEENVEITFEDSQHPKRLYLILVATVVRQGREYKLGSDELFQGQKHKRAESLIALMVKRVVASLADDLRSGAYVDKHMADQLVVFQALAAGKSNIWRGVTDSGQAQGQSLHAETAEWLSREMVGAHLKMGKGRGVGFPAGGSGAAKSSK